MKNRQVAGNRSRLDGVQTRMLKSHEDQLRGLLVHSAVDQLRSEEWTRRRWLCPARARQLGGLEKIRRMTVNTRWLGALGSRNPICQRHWGGCLVGRVGRCRGL